MDTLELFGHTGARRQTEARRVGSVHFTPGAQKFGVRGGFCGCRLKARLPGPGEEAGFGVWWSSGLGAWPWATSLSPSAQLKSETPLGRVLGGDTRKAVSLGPAGLSVLGEMASRLNTETRDARVPGTRAGLSTQGIEWFLGGVLGRRAWRWPSRCPAQAVSASPWCLCGVGGGGTWWPRGICQTWGLHRGGGVLDAVGKTHGVHTRPHREI